MGMAVALVWRLVVCRRGGRCWSHRFVVDSVGWVGLYGELTSLSEQAGRLGVD
jgi:hypothetical protein